MALQHDLATLQEGRPPADPGLLARMTLGREVWLDLFRRYQLEAFLPGGGSKVKVLVGPGGSGKSHLLRCIGQDARDLGYAVVALSARDLGHKLGDLPALYRTIARNLDLAGLVDRLCLQVVSHLGYGSDYPGSGPLWPFLCDRGMPAEEARRDIREAAAVLFRPADLAPDFATFAQRVVRARLVQDSEEQVRLLVGWLAGDKHDRAQKLRTGQFEVLRKPSARTWLTSLLGLLRLAGWKGLVVTVDDLEAMAERSPDTNRWAYTVAQAQDTLELLRQVIDDAEVLTHFALILAGRETLIEDTRRGFKSYEALWMRLQTGLVKLPRFNSLADLVDVERMQQVLGEDFPEQVARRVTLLLDDLDVPRNSQAPRMPTDGWNLRDAVVAAATRF